MRWVPRFENAGGNVTQWLEEARLFTGSSRSNDDGSSTIG